MNQKSNGRSAIEAHVISFLKETEGTTLCRKALFDSVLRLPKVYPGTLYRQRYRSNKCQLLRHAKKWTEVGYSHKWRGSLSQGVVLLHEYARPHTGHLTINTVQKMNWEVLERPAHSPDLAPSNFPLFRPLKNALSGRQFADYDDVKEAVNDWLHNQTNPPPSGFKKLRYRWVKFIQNKDYVEN